MDYIIAMESIGLATASQLGIADKIKMSPLIFARVPIYFSMNRAKYQKKFPEIESALHKRTREDGPKYKLIKDVLHKE
ncbi:MAG: hypothetical protein J7501_16260 [Bdellovibrio sp.]|nr:hypothetical protein [Bdellovibrio sp.]